MTTFGVWKKTTAFMVPPEHRSSAWASFAIPTVWMSATVILATFGAVRSHYVAEYEGRMAKLDAVMISIDEQMRMMEIRRMQSVPSARAPGERTEEYRI